MKLFALPENVLNHVATLLQELPFKSANGALIEIQKARMLVDDKGNAIEDAPAVAASTTDVA